MRKLFIALSVLATSLHTNAQIIDRIKNSAKNTAERKAENRSSDVVDKSIDKIEEGIGNLFKKKEKKTSTINTNTTAAQSKNRSNTKVDTKKSIDKDSIDYFFIDDFSISNINIIPKTWHIYDYDPNNTTYESPGIKVLSEERWFKMPRKGFIFPYNIKNLPQNFVLEFDLYADPNLMNEMEGGFRTNLVAKNDREEYSIHWAKESALELDVHPHGKTDKINIYATSGYSNGSSGKEKYFDKTFTNGWNSGEINKIKIIRTGNNISLYVNDAQMTTVSNKLKPTLKYNIIFSTNLWGDGMYVRNIRIIETK